MPPPVQRYEELRIRIDEHAPNRYRVLATTKSADASGNFALPFNELELENFVLRVSRPRGRRRIDSSALGDAKQFGGALFKALFRDDVSGIYHEALTTARNKGSGLRITLCLSGAPALMDVPWEYLFDEPDFLAASAFTPVVRYLDLPRGNRPLRVAPPLRILGIVSSPTDYQRLDVEREQANLSRALSGITEAGAVELEWLKQPTLSTLLRTLQKGTFHVLHYVGHGAYDESAEEGLLLFEDETGRSRPVTGDKLGMILHDFTSLRLVVLNACEGARTARTDPFAGVAQALVQRDIPAVIAMQFEISDEAAITFAEGFYDALAAGSPADASLAAARLAMLAEHSDDIEWGTPVLFMRVPDGRLFDVGKHRVSSRAATRILDRPEPVADAPAGTGPAAARHVQPPAESRRAGPSRPRDAGDRVDYRSRRRLRWLLALPVAAALVAAVLVLTAGSSTSNAQTVQQWLQAFDRRSFDRAITYWRVPALWIGLRGKQDVFASIGQLKVYLEQRAACHKVLDQVIIDPAKSNVVTLRVSIDRALPGLASEKCRSVGGFWYEDYLMDGGRIVTLRIRAPGGSAQPPKHGTTTSTTTGATPASTGASSSVTATSATSTPGSASSTSVPSETTTASETTAVTLSTTLPTPPPPPGG